MHKHGSMVVSDVVTVEVVDKDEVAVVVVTLVLGEVVSVVEVNDVVSVDEVLIDVVNEVVVLIEVVGVEVGVVAGQWISLPEQHGLIPTSGLGFSTQASWQ